MFRGSYEVKVDDKVRAKLPGGFLKVLERNEWGKEFFVTSFDGQIGQIWPLVKWEEKEAEWALIPDESREKQRFMDQVNFYGQQVELDAQDRLLLPQRLRGKARLVGEVDILGAGVFMKIANHDTMEQIVGEGGTEQASPVTMSDSMDYMAEQGRILRSQSKG
jgi:MraZ protein